MRCIEQGETYSRLARISPDVNVPLYPTNYVSHLGSNYHIRGIVAVIIVTTGPCYDPGSVIGSQTKGPGLSIH
jgi:hypothetical protein